MGSSAPFRASAPHPHFWLGEIPALSPSSLQAGSLAGRESGCHTVFLLQLKCFHSVLQMVLEAVPEPLR